MKSHLLIASVLALFLTGCVKRIPAYDEARKPITDREIKQNKTSKNLLIYALGGGSLSFGASFFIGTLIDRGVSDDRNNAALWGTTAAGTVLGTFIFAKQGNTKDRNDAIEMAREIRKKNASKKLTEVKSKRKKLDKELQSLEALRRQQEAERKALEEQIKKKKKKP